VGKYLTLFQSVTRPARSPAPAVATH